MDPFVLSRNAFHIYCSEYATYNSSTAINNNQSINSSDQIDYRKAVCILNQRYEYFLQTLERLRTSFEQTTRNQNINSIRNREKDSLTVASITSKQSHRKHSHKSNKPRMPKIFLTVSCNEHQTQKQPNIKMN
jgi:hypothetical protein